MTDIDGDHDHWAGAHRFEIPSHNLLNQVHGAWNGTKLLYYGSDYSGEPPEWK
jgi:hypothetical protein